MSVFIVGRDTAANIVVPGQHHKVSRRHAEIRVVDGGNYRIEDLGTVNGTEIYNEGRWQKVTKAVVTANHRVRFGGQFEATVADLLALAGGGGGGTRVAGGPATQYPGAPQYPGATQYPGAAPYPAAGGAYPQPHSHAPPAGYGAPPRAAHLRAGPPTALVDQACPHCGAMVMGDTCHACGGQVVAGAQDIAAVLAQDIFNIGDRQNLGERLLLLLLAPVRGTLAMAEDPAFRLHGVMLAIATVLYFASTRLQEYLFRDTGQQSPVTALIETLRTFSLDHPQNPTPEFLRIAIQLITPDIIVLGLVYLFFCLMFFISYYVFVDYSDRPKSARGYLKLCCISWLVLQVASFLPLLPLVAMRIQVLDPGPAVWLFKALLLFVIFFYIHYALQTATRFWSISYVSAFRGYIISGTLAFVAGFLFAFFFAGVISLMADLA